MSRLPQVLLEGLQVVELTVAELAERMVHQQLTRLTELPLLEMLLHFWLCVQSLLDQQALPVVQAHVT